MQCPYCKNEMQEGYIEQTDFRFPLKWYSCYREPKFFAKDRGVKLTSTFKNCSVTAHRCEQCKKIIIDENNLDI